MIDRQHVQVHPEVAQALANGSPVVALESTIISHGLPRPRNLDVARDIEQAVRNAGAVPATIAIVDGSVRIGLDDLALQTIAAGEDAPGSAVVKVGVRDLAPVMARGGHGATTVAATSHLAHLVGISVFATGGLGGVHRGARETWDESADLITLARVPITVVCAGVKSILDVQATIERLETLNVAVLGLRTDRFPGFYLSDSGHGLHWRVEDEAAIADVIQARNAIGVTTGVVVANPVAPHEQLDAGLHDRVLASGLKAAEDAGISGKDVTPFLLDYFHRETQGASLEVNVALVKANAGVAGRIAAHLSQS